MFPYTILVLLWVGWCFLHSVLITKTVTGYLAAHFGKAYPYYRFFYNVIALATLVPVLGFTFSIDAPPVFRWIGWGRLFQGLLAVSALFFFIAGAKRYDMAQFLGFRQIREDKACSVLTDTCRLDTSGILGVVRHPWYTGGILVVWARDLDVAAILMNLVISGYFIVGAILEERKLVAEFGKEYMAYQQRVSMLVPIKWFLNYWRE